MPHGGLGAKALDQVNGCQNQPWKDPTSEDNGISPRRKVFASEARLEDTGSITRSIYSIALLDAADSSSERKYGPLLRLVACPLIISWW